jgi:hypothetical protein
VVKVLTAEELFWHRVDNLEKAMNNAEHWEFKALFKNKLIELMKKLPKRMIN